MSRFSFSWILLIILLSICVGCDNDQGAIESSGDNTSKAILLQGNAQGTTYSIKYLGEENVTKNDVDSLLDRFDQDISNWVDNSLIRRLNAHSRTDTVFAFYDSTLYFSVLFDVSREIYRKTEGAFDPTVYPLVELWGFGLKNRAEVTQELVDEKLAFVGFQESNIDMIELNEDTYIYKETNIRKGAAEVKLDFNAIAQGYSVDLIGELLESREISNFMIELGGEVLCRGVNESNDPWRIAIDKPNSNAEGRELQAILSLDNKAVATSGSYRKFYEKDGIKYSHAIDPRSGYPVQHSLLSVTVVTNQCAAADAYATAFLVMGLEESLEFLASNPLEGLEVYFILNEGGELKTVMTSGMNSIVAKAS